MKLTSFSGGLSTRVAAHLIKQTEARVLVNVDTDKETLTPIKANVNLEQAIKRYFHYNTIEDTWVSYDSPADFVEYSGKLYICDRVNRPIKIKDGVSTNVGITNPTGVLALTQVSAPDPIETVEFVNGSGSGDLPRGESKYKIVNKSSVTGLTSFTHHTSPVREVTSRPTATHKSSFFADQVRTNISKFKTYAATIRIPTETKTTITVTDVNADLVRIYRYLDGYWRALTATFQAASIPVVDEVYDISANDALDEVEFVTGEVQYAITFYDSTNDVESGVLLSPEISSNNGRVTISNIPVSAEPGVDTVRIYRIGGNLTTFSLVDEVPNGATTYVDTTGDTEIIGTVLPTVSNSPAPAGLKYLKEAYAMLFGALGTKLRFTPVGKPDSWPEAYYLEFSRPITGISKTAMGLLVHTQFNTHLVTGSGPTSLAQQLLSSDQGCVSHDSIKETKDTALWVSTDGICASDGSDVKVISKKALGKLDLSSIVCSILYDQVYQVLLSSGIVYALDIEFGIFKQFEYGVNYLHVAKDSIYGHSNGALFKVAAASEYAALSYRSATIVTGGFAQEKIYTKVQVYSTGTSELKVYIDDALVIQYTLKAGFNERKIPQESRRGRMIAFEVTGTASINEIQWDEATSND